MNRCPAYGLTYATAVGESTRCGTCGRTWLLSDTDRGPQYVVTRPGNPAAHR